MQSSSQQSSLGEAPGGEMLAGKPEGEAVRVGVELGQGLHPHALSKSQAKKQRKLSKSQSQPMQAPPAQHYKEKILPSPAPTDTTVAEGITKESAFEQRAQHMTEPEKETQRQRQAAATESPFLAESSAYQKPMETTNVTSLEPPLLSPAEKDRQMQARKEIDRLEEMERQDRITRAKLEDEQELARREASLMGTVREEEAERSRRIEEADIIDRREAESEASLEKTKALEEIEKRRRLYSLAEKSRQQLAAKASAILFPHAPRPHLAEAKLWTASGLLKRETPLPTLEEKPRFGQFIATTTKTTTAHLPHGTVHSKPFELQPSSSVVSESRIGPGPAPQLTLVETSSFGAEQLAPSTTTSKVCKETYRSQSRPRLVVHHTGLSGKWQRETETVELHEGVDY